MTSLSTPWLLGALALLVGGLGPAAWLGCRGEAAARLVGLELGSSVTVLVLLLLARPADSPRC